MNFEDLYQTITCCYEKLRIPQVTTLLWRSSPILYPIDRDIGEETSTRHHEREYETRMKMSMNGDITDNERTWCDNTHQIMGTACTHPTIVVYYDNNYYYNCCGMILLNPIISWCHRITFFHHLWHLHCCFNFSLCSLSRCLRCFIIHV